MTKKLSLNHKWQLYKINFETLVLGFTRLQGFVGLVPGVPLLFHTQSLRPRERYLKFEAFNFQIVTYAVICRRWLLPSAWTDTILDHLDSVTLKQIPFYYLDSFLWFRSTMGLGPCPSNFAFLRFLGGSRDPKYANWP